MRLSITFVLGAIISIAAMSCYPNQNKITQLESENLELKAKVKSLEARVSLLEHPVVFNKKQVTKAKKKAGKPAPTEGLQIEASLPTTDQSSLVTEPITPAPISPTPVNRSFSTPAPKATSSGQCQATTKKGYQCSRRARSGGYCWQHGG